MALNKFLSKTEIVVSGFSHFIRFIDEWQAACHTSLKTVTTELSHILSQRKKENDLSTMTSLADSFYDELQYIDSTEKQLVKYIPKMEKKATCKELTAAFEKYLEQTKVQQTKVQV